MICKKCGGELEENALFCRFCGSRIEEQPVTESSETIYNESNTEIASQGSLDKESHDENDKHINEKDNSKNGKKHMAFILCIIFTTVVISVACLSFLKTEEYRAGQHENVSVNEHCIVAIKNDGTVHSTKFQDVISKWTDIIDVSVGDNFVVALTSDGKVCLAGNNKNNSIDVSLWHDIVDVTAGADYVVGISRDGYAHATGDNDKGQLNVDDWNNIVAVDAGLNHTLGLKKDGTVVAQGAENMFKSYGECAVSEWIDVTYISAGYGLSMGAKKDGTLLYAGGNPEYFGPDDSGYNSDISTYTGIEDVSAGKYGFAARQGDGTVVLNGRNLCGECYVEDLTGMASVVCGETYILGLQFDGTLRVLQCKHTSKTVEADYIDSNYIESWKNIRTS